MDIIGFDIYGFGLFDVYVLNGCVDNVVIYFGMYCGVMFGVVYLFGCDGVGIGNLLG